MRSGKPSFILLPALGLLAFIAACGPSAPKQPTVFVSIAPQQFLVEQIAGDRLQVEVLVQPGHSPATYEPTPKQVTKLSQAKAFFHTGVPFEKAFMPKVKSSVAGLELIDLRSGLELRELEAHHHHHHGEECTAHHGEKDPHCWLSPRLAMIQAATVNKALAKIDPDGKDHYQKNFDALQGKLQELDERLTAALKPLKGRSFMVFHPAWGYFADAYELRQVAIEVDGKAPSARQLKEAVEDARKEGVKVIFVQPQFDRKSAEIIAKEIGAKVVAIDPLAKDYIANLDEVAKQLAAALQ